MSLERQSPPSEGDCVKVSVLMTTYNHEKFIAQAVESVLMQKVDFDYEIVIGEDCSLDRTRSILMDFHERYSNRIRLSLSERNSGGYGHVNFSRALQICRGQYIALLEGDDYWTSRLKLQKQVNFLDRHPECAMCFHAVEIAYEAGERSPHLYPKSINKAIFTIEDLLAYGNFIQTCSIMFRAGLFGEIPEWWYDVAPGDWALHILNAMHGDIGYIDEILGVYRVHSSGKWSSADKLSTLRRSIEAAEIIRDNLDQDRYKRRISNIVARWHYLSAKILYQEGNLSEALSHVQKVLRVCPCHPDIPKAFLLKVIFRANFPRVFAVLHKAKANRKA